MERSSCLPSREWAVVMLHSLLRFLSLRLDECTGNREPGVMGCTATAGRLCLGPLSLKSDALGSSALLARNRDNQLFLGLGQQRVRAETARRNGSPKRLAERSTTSNLGTAATLWWRRRQLEKACQMSRTLLARARTRAHTTSEQLVSSRGSLAEPGLLR
jgi:hypothetical protein